MKSAITLLLVLFITTLLFSQPAIVWQATHGDQFYDDFQDVIVSNDGSIYAVGTIHFLPNTPGAKGANDVLLVKYSFNGSLTWQKVYGGSSDDEGYRLMEMAGGNIAILANSESMDGDVGGNNGNIDVWIFTIDTAGTLQWEVNIGGAGFDRAASLMQSSSGLAVAYEKGAPDRDLAISFVTYSGSVQSSYYYGTSCIDKCTDGLALGDGTFLLLGVVNCANEDVSHIYAADDVWLVRVNTLGQIVWEKTFGGQGTDYPHGIALGSDGRLYVSSESIFSSNDVPPLKGGYDLWYMAIDTADGNLAWSKAYGTAGNDYAGKIMEYGNMLYAIGSAGGSGGDLSGSSKGSEDLWLLQMDTAGNLLWEANFGSSLSDKGFGVFANADHILAAGFSGKGDGDVSPGPFTQNAWLLELGMTTAIGEDRTDPIIIYPNPFYTNLKVEIPGKATLRVYKFSGGTAFRTEIDDAQTLDLGFLPSGIYLLEISTVSERVIRKVIKL